MSRTPSPRPASPRSTPAQAGPPASLQGISTTRPAASSWYREHGYRASSTDGGCWYYAALPADPSTGGRFDVPAPAGTCYFANRPLVAAMERVGRFTAQHKPVPTDLLTDRVVTEVGATDLPATAVNLLAERAATLFGITGELFTTPDYSIPQAWAHAIHDQGHPALVHTPRFSPSGRAIAVFGSRGPQPAATTSVQPLAAVLRDADVPIVAIPRASAVRFVSPPTP